MTESLHEIGIENITLAKDGAEAFDQLKKKSVHLIISDQYMPNPTRPRRKSASSSSREAPRNRLSTGDV